MGEVWIGKEKVGLSYYFWLAGSHSAVQPSGTSGGGGRGGGTGIVESNCEKYINMYIDMGVSVVFIYIRGRTRLLRECLHRCKEMRSDERWDVIML